jgi:hypothetical protein
MKHKKVPNCLQELYLSRIVHSFNHIIYQKMIYGRSPAAILIKKNDI